MMLAETEYRHQIEAVIRPFRDILLGLFFISVGMLLDVHLLARASELHRGVDAPYPGDPQGGHRRAGHTPLHHFALQGAAHRHRHVDRREFGVALCTILLQAGMVPEGLASRAGRDLLSMLLSPLILNNNKRVAAGCCMSNAPAPTASERKSATPDRAA